MPVTTARYIGPLAGVLAGLFCFGAAAQNVPAGVTWDWQLQAPLDLSVAVDILALDPDEVSAADIAALSSRGVTTVCYVSVGTWEDWRADAGNFPQVLLGRAYDGWPGERFLDIRAPELLPLMRARVQHCAEMGFDAVEPDNIDLHINDTGFGIVAADVLTYFTALSDMAHDLGLRIAQKNAGDLTERLAPLADFAMAENCLTDGWCADLSVYPNTGRAILAAEYAQPSAAVCAVAAELGLSLIFKRHALTRWRQICPD